MFAKRQPTVPKGWALVTSDPKTLPADASYWGWDCEMARWSSAAHVIQRGDGPFIRPNRPECSVDPNDDPSSDPEDAIDWRDTRLDVEPTFVATIAGFACKIAPYINTSTDHFDWQVELPAAYCPGNYSSAEIRGKAPSVGQAKKLCRKVAELLAELAKEESTAPPREKEKYGQKSRNVRREDPRGVLHGVRDESEEDRES
jgi:hypothetical protein